MKKSFLICLTITLALAACNKEPANPVEGAWSLIYAKSVENDSIINSFPGNYEGSQIKMWTDNYWMFAGRYILDTITEDAFGGGTYTLEGVVYKESIMYHSADSYIGQTFRMRIVVENDTLVQVWPAMENGEIDKSNYQCEKYVKVK
ncbi:MAG: hypothetical protein MUC78_06400 [Bacteroidales bacterium]|jgi:hypothetical protein|nr:hypothetical protein [Bacteroidales bacterium]